MKHPASRDLYARWQTARRRRNSLPPQPLRGYRFRICADPAGPVMLVGAGAELRALLSLEPDETFTARPFTTLFSPASRATVAGLIAITTTEKLATVAGVSAACEAGTAALELLLLPAAGKVMTAPATATLDGLLAPLAAQQATLRALTVTSWRHLHPPQPPRALRKVAVAPGVVLYEGRR